MRIERASEMGFCFGVRRSVKLVAEALQRYGGLDSLGPTVHNQEVVSAFTRQGMRVVENLNQVRSKVIAIPAHGAGREVIEEAQKRGLEVIDTTCPMVRRVQTTAAEMSEREFLVVIFGESNHTEVKGILGWVGERGIATMDSAAVLNLFRNTCAEELPSRLGILSQTTQNRSQFAHFVSQIIEALLPNLRELQVINTICDATWKRQQSALEIARRVDMMLVIGGRNSANTRRLAEICTAAGVETHHIEVASEIEDSWLRRETTGITAGASTPDYVIEEVIASLREKAQDI